MNKKIKYKFNALALVFIALGIVCGLICAVLNVIRFAKLLNSSEIASSTDYMSTTIAALIGIFAVVVLIALLLNSYYSVDDKNFVARWGFFANKIPTKDITGITHFKLTDKLVVYYSADNFFVINAKSVDYEKIIAALLTANKKIVYIDNSTDKND